MCLITLAYGVHEQYPMILSSNRDEFLSRPTQHAHFWKDDPNLLAGRDLEGMGTWLGVTRTGRFAALTNYRDTHLEVPKQPRSRGLIVSGFLQQTISPESFLETLSKSRKDYLGYNLILGTASSMWYYSNIQNDIQELSPGIYGLSNHFLDTPWPKVSKAKRYMMQCLKTSLTEPNILQQCLFNSLLDGQPARDEKLPNTGISYSFEKNLSSIFINLENYGTRASTIVTISKDKHIDFIEYTMANGNVNHESKFQFTIQN